MLDSRLRKGIGGLVVSWLPSNLSLFSSEIALCSILFRHYLASMWEMSKERCNAPSGEE